MRRNLTVSRGPLSLVMRVTACLLICLGLTRCTPATGLALLCLVSKERWNQILIFTVSSLAGMSATLMGCLTALRPSSPPVVVRMLCVMRWPIWLWWTALLSLRAPVCWARLLTSICVRSKVSGRLVASPPMPTHYANARRWLRRPQHTHANLRAPLPGNADGWTGLSGGRAQGSGSGGVYNLRSPPLFMH